MSIFKLMDWVFPLRLYQSNVAAAVIGGAVVGGAVNAYSANTASNAQQSAASTAENTQLDMYNTTNAQQAPYRAAGDTALGQLSDGTAPGGQFTHTFDANDLNSNLAPNYNFQLQQGLGAVNNQNSVAGGLVGGNALKGISDYAQNSAASAYQQAFNNYNTNQTNIYNRLSNIAGLGQTANGQSATSASNAASNIGSAQLANGAASAAGTIGTGNAISGAINNASGWYAGLNSGGYSGSGTGVSNGVQIYGNGTTAQAAGFTQ